MTMNREMTDIKIEPDGLLIPPQYLDGLGPTAIVRRIKGGLIVESRDQAQAREELRALVERIRAAVKSDAPGDAEIGAIVDEARTERARRR
jgi:hypothetical protein